MIFSGCADGLVAVSNASTGMVVRVISDHQGAPITDLHTTRRIPKVPSASLINLLSRVTSHSGKNEFRVSRVTSHSGKNEFRVSQDGSIACTCMF